MAKYDVTVVLTVEADSTEEAKEVVEEFVCGADPSIDMSEVVEVEKW